MTTDTQHGFNVAQRHGRDHDAENDPALPRDRHGGSAAHRFSSSDPAVFPVPTGREEEWRFTPLKRLRGLHDGTVAGGADVSPDVAVPDGVTVERVGRDDPRVGSSGYVPVDVVSARAWSSFATATVVTLPADRRIEEPVTVTVRGDVTDEAGASPAAAWGHLVIEARPHGEAVVILDHTGTATYADNVEIVAREGAQLTVVSMQNWSGDAVHAGHHHVLVGRDAHVRHVIVSFGGDVVRVCASVDYAAAGGNAELLGLYFADPGQHIEHRLFVDHAQPHCRSNVAYKGALQGRDAHTVWVGDVLIRPSAVGTDTYELNRNLVLTDGARADSVPNLEIETGEVVGAGHASATGRFDDEQLFYLQARGIPAAEARRLVVRGFFASLVNQIGVPQITERLLETVERELDEVVA